MASRCSRGGSPCPSGSRRKSNSDRPDSRRRGALDVTAVPGCAGPDRIIQLHPTLRCNLRCPHCYSESGPTADTDLDVDALCATLTDARALGFTVAAISGGEPTLWRELPVLLEHA